MKILTVGILVGIVLPRLVAAPAPKLLREYDLRQISRELKGELPPQHAVLNLVFSPDDRWLAIGVAGQHTRLANREPAPANDQLLIVPLNGAVQSIQIATQRTIADGRFGGDLYWSSDSHLLALGQARRTVMYQVPTGEPLDWRAPSVLGAVLGFIRAGQLLATRAPEDPLKAIIAREPWSLLSLDLAGNIVGQWTAPSGWVVTSISPENGLVIMGDLQSNKDFVFDYNTKSVVQGHFEGASFAESGKSICSGGGYQRGSLPARCWDVATGKKISQFTSFKGGVVDAISAAASRIVLSHIRLFKGITEEYDLHSFKDRVVWDFRQNKEIAEWSPKYQNTPTGFKRPNDTFREWARVTISPSGHYLAEGGNDSVRIYELPPVSR